MLRNLMNKSLRNCFEADSLVTIAEAPARLDVMGGIADYSGSLVLEGTLGRRARACVARQSERSVRVVTLGIDDPGIEPDVTVPLKALHSGERLNDYEAVRAFFNDNAKTRWAGYVAGCLYVLMAEGRCPRPDHGLTIVIESDIPLGAGVSSSAAIEVATMTALVDVLNIQLKGLELASLCQIVENRVVGAPCGIMDQVTCALGDAGRLLALRCQPHELLGTFPLPEGVHAVGINSNVRHSVSGQKYTRARVGAFMGLRILQDHFGDERLGGYLCSIAPKKYESELKELLPESMQGGEFLERYGQTPDRVTRIVPDETYRIRACAEHPIYENDRVQRFLDLMQSTVASARREDLIAAGKLMYESHDSYGNRCDLGSPETDLLVELVRERGPEQGLYGAKITGGGGGGTVAVLCQKGADESLREILEDCERQTGLTPEEFSGSLPGALQRGVVRRPAKDLV